MMSDLFFVLRMFVFTIVVVIFAQVHVGQKSLEDHFQEWVKTSMFVDSIQEAIDGGINLTKITYKKADLGIHGVLAKMHSHKDKKDRGFHFSLKRYNDKEDEEADGLAHAQTPPSKTK